MFFKSFLDVVSTLAAFIAINQLIQIFLMPAVPKMLSMLLSGKSVEWSVPEISLTQTH